jgi:ribosomal protein L29
VRKTKDELTQQEKDLSQAIDNYIRSQSEEELRDFVREGRKEFFQKSDFNVDKEIAEFILDNTILGQRKATTDSDELLELAINSYINSKSRKELESLVREYKDTFFYESDFGTTEERYDFILEHGAKTGLETRKKQVLEFIFEGTLVLTADQVSTPEDPSQQEVMDLISNITTIKELGSFIRSTTFATGDKRELNRQKVVGFINELRLEVSSTAQSKNNPQAGNKKNSPKNTQPL